MKKLLLLSAMALSLIGCVTTTPPITSNSKPKQSLAYMYGNFEKTKEQTYINSGLIFRKVGEETEYIAKFLRKDSRYMIEVEPGQYQLWGLFLANGEGSFKRKVPFEQGEQENIITVDANTANYVGDYLMQDWVILNLFIGDSALNWKLEKATEEFIVTSESIKEKHPEFKDLKFVDGSHDIPMQKFFTTMNKILGEKSYL